MDKITRRDLHKLRDFIKAHKDDPDSPVVWMAKILYKLSKESY